MAIREPLLPHNLSRRIEKLAVGGSLANKSALTKLALAIERKAKENANTGHHAPHGAHIPGTGPGPNTATLVLRRGITHTPPEPVGFGWTTRIGTADVAYYAKWVELGLKNGARYPFLNPAVDDMNAARGTARDVLVMRDDNDGQTVLVQMAPFPR